MRDLPDPEKAKPCILVIDDDVMIAPAIAARLGSDFRVIATTEPAQAVAMALREQPSVILCDINMPAMKGDEVAFALSEDPDTAEIPLIYLTDLVSPDDDMELSGEFGDFPAMSKSASTSELLEMIEQALGNS
jgi:CheY-like chemotaxis protein